MAKKNKKSFYKKQVKPFLKGNKVLLAALGGAAAGITLVNIIGSEKAQQILHTVEDSLTNFADKVSKSMSENAEENVPSPERKKTKERNKETVTSS